MPLLGSFSLALPLGVAVVVLAALFRKLPGSPRWRLRRSVILYVLYLGLAAALWTTQRLLAGAAAITVLRAAFQLCELILIINLAALLIFDLAIRLTRIDLSDIVHDLALGLAYLGALFWSMHQWGVNLTGIVATSAVATAVIGLSLQSTLGNVIGGIALQLDDSIREGDWLVLESKLAGCVKKVRWRHTVLETTDYATLIVPNSQLLAQTIKIWGKRDAQPPVYRMTVPFNVDHRYAPGDVIRVVNEALTAAPIECVARDPVAHTICLDLARDNRDSFCCYAVRFFLTDFDRDESTASAVRERIYVALQCARIPLALPATTVFLSQEDGKAERRRERQRAETVNALKNVELFSRLSGEELQSLADTAQLTPFAKGELVTRQGATAHWLYVLVKGEVEVRIHADGQDRRVARLSAPNFFGEMALMTGAPREATVVALGNVECLRVDKDGFRQVLSQRDEVAHEISSVLAQRRVELEAARENLDAETKLRRMQTERGRILASIRDFFALKN